MNWIWIAVRVTGLAAYLLLTLSMIGGMLRHLPKKKAGLLEFHQLIGQVGLLLIGVHALLLVFDSYQPYSVLEVLIPFSSSFEPFYSGIGTIATFLLILVVWSSDFMKLVGKSMWKKLHYLVFPVWALSNIHGFFLGTDSTSAWALMLYIGCSVAVLLSVMYMVSKTSSSKMVVK